ncbi:hypothetical protein A4R26_33390 [Niastella populi]|uniref:Uncharacterized protein n=2 Tax=Niastella populi TaxID=550983 RepID=A0A1V9GA43_9BACT|nr:hypothetical protein A4R26_33390 [Niastella populi]
MTCAWALAQDTTSPVLYESNRIILHFTDTSGKFLQLARIFIDRGYDIDMKDPELGILRTKPGPLRGGAHFTDQVEIKSIFRDSTITLSGVTHSQSTGHDWSVYDIKAEVSYSKKRYSNVRLSWEEMEKIAALLQPAFITYSRVDVTEKSKKMEGWQYKRNN